MAKKPTQTIKKETPSKPASFSSKSGNISFNSSKVLVLKKDGTPSSLN